MLVNNLLYTIISIVIPIVLWVGLSIFFKKKWNSYYGILIGLVLSGFSFGAFQTFGKIYIIDQNLNVSANRLVGSLKYEFIDGTDITLELSTGETGIINNSNEQLVLEELIYGPEGYFKNRPEYEDIVRNIDSTYAENLSNSDKEIVINSLSFFTSKIEKNTINYFFDDEIPKTIEEYGSYGNVQKYWLRKR